MGSYLKVQVEEQSRMIEHLKQALNASSIDLERRMLDQRSMTKSEKPNHHYHKSSVTNQHSSSSQLTESENKIAKMEHEISLYKDKLAQLNQLKSNPNHYQSDVSNDQSSSNNNNNGFYLTNENQFKSRSSNAMIDSLVENQHSGTSAGATTTPSTVKVVKVSRKDLRRLTDEEVLKRSLNKKDTSD